MRRGPPVPGGVIWWDKKGEQHHTWNTPVPSNLALAAVVCLFSFVIFVISVSLIIMGVNFAGEAVLITGIVATVISFGLMVPFFVMKFREKSVIPIVFPGTHYTPTDDRMTVLPPGCFVEYIVEGTRCLHPPKGYLPPVALPIPAPATHESHYHAAGGEEMPPTGAHAHYPVPVGAPQGNIPPTALLYDPAAQGPQPETSAPPTDSQGNQTEATPGGLLGNWPASTLPKIYVITD